MRASSYRSGSAKAHAAIAKLLIALILVAFCTNVAILLGLQNGKDHEDDNNNKNKDFEAMRDRLQKKKKTTATDSSSSSNQSSSNTTKSFVTGTLHCDEYGGPSDEIARELVYWQDHDVGEEKNNVSPFQQPNKNIQYMTFEPDCGGWNNVRMAFETALAFAWATGRTLVLPPSQSYWSLQKKGGVSLADFFNMEAIASAGVNVITMQQFLERHAMTGKLVHQKTSIASFPPQHNRTNWNGAKKQLLRDQLFSWLRNVTTLIPPSWNPDQCIAAIPTMFGDEKAITRLKRIEKHVLRDNRRYKDFIGKPTPVNGPPEERLRENWAGRKSLCVYNQKLQEAPVLHFSLNLQKGVRTLMVPFYGFVFLEEWKRDLAMKRFVRDSVRYNDEIQCAAARVVHAVRQRAAKQSNQNKMGHYDSIHVRRRDFQKAFPWTDVDSFQIYNVSKEQLTEGGTLYVATDEQNKTWFQGLANHYDLVFLKDFEHLLKGLDKNKFGMVDQIVAAQGRVFFGIYYSTFSGYIHRIRGYHVDSKRLPGHEDGTIPSYYFAPADKKNEMQEYYPLYQHLWAREFPTAWHNINEGIQNHKAQLYR